jgi:hypothetical protein
VVDNREGTNPGGGTVQAPGQLIVSGPLYANFSVYPTANPMQGSFSANGSTFTPPRGRYSFVSHISDINRAHSVDMIGGPFSGAASLLAWNATCGNMSGTIYYYRY